MNTLAKDAIESGLMDSDYHERLMADIHGVVQQAGIPESYVWTPMSTYCGETEIDFVINLSTHVDSIKPVFGMVYIGNVEGKPINDRMMAIAGACLRNYINAKVMTLMEVLTALRDNSMPSPTVLLIPNFFMGRSGSGKIAEWETPLLLDMLYKRQQESKQTVLYVSAIDALEAEYGHAFTDHLDGKFVPVGDAF